MNDNSGLYREQYLRHYGVLGMRWGVRRGSKSSKSSSKKTSDTNIKKRRMSNKELTARVKRLKLEEEFRKLTSPPKPATKSVVERIVSAADMAAKVSGSAATIYSNLESLGVVKRGG